MKFYSINDYVRCFIVELCMFGRFSLINYYERLYGLHDVLFFYDLRMNIMNGRWKLLIHVIRLWIVMDVNEFG